MICTINEYPGQNLVIRIELYMYTWATRFKH